MSETIELTERQRYWLAHIEACGESGLSARAYADEHGLKVSRLYNARHQLKAKSVLFGDGTEQAQAVQSAPTEAKARFQRVVVRPEAEANSAAFSAPRSSQGVVPCRIHLPNGVMLEVMTVTDAAALTAVVVAAGAWP